MGNKFKTITSSDDIVDFLKTFDGFHDSFVTEVSMNTGYSVNAKLQVTTPFEPMCNVKVIFQRPNRLLRTIELVFEKVTRFNFVPAQENGDRIIYSAQMLKLGETYYWADVASWKPENKDDDNLVCWIAAKEIKWKELKSYRKRPSKRLQAFRWSRPRKT